jgi:S1-C subfamily serine protease
VAQDAVEMAEVDPAEPVPAGPEFVAPFGDEATEDDAPAGPDGRRARALVMVACMLATGLLGGFVGAQLGNDDDFRPAALPPISRSATARVSTPGSLADVIERVSPAVVGIRSRGARLGIGQGTGFIYTPDGEIVTNSHVINGAKTILVTLPGEDQARSAEVIGNDEDEDLAVVRIKDVTGLPTVEIGDSRSVRIGEEVFAIGHALGLSGGPSVSRGVVSGLQRANGPLAELIQTDAALNPGNSGGPLFDASGRVIGVNTMVRAGAENIGFAIPMERVRVIVERLREGKPTPPMAFLGVRTQPAEDGGPGAEVVDVTDGTPAHKAGLVEGDRIVAVDGDRVSGPESLANLIRGRAPGDHVELTFRRDGVEQTATITLATKDPEVN